MRAARQDIQDATCELGAAMDAALPWKKSGWLRRITGRNYLSEATIMPGCLDPQQRITTIGQLKGRPYTRAWLARDPTKRPDDSTVSLIADAVTLRGVDISRYQDSRVIARWNKEMYGLKLNETLGTEPNETLEWIRELGGWVAQIAEANQHDRLADEMPRLTPERTLAP